MHQSSSFLLLIFQFLFLYINFFCRHREHQVRLCRGKGHNPAGEKTIKIAQEMNLKKQNDPKCKIIHLDYL